MANAIIPDGQTKAVGDFKTEFARTLLVSWADVQIQTGKPSFELVHLAYLDLAYEKGWVSRKSGLVTAKGFSTAAAFLRR